MMLFPATLALLPQGAEWWVVATASACGCACGLLGTYLVLRRLSMLGDALTHAILPGLAGAFLLTGTRNPVAMLVGAMLVGLLTSVLSAGLARVARVQQDAALGVVFTALFAAGVLMITAAADQVDLDPGCVLYGMLETLTLTPAGSVPRQFVLLASVLGVALVVLVLFSRRIKLVAFHAEMAKSLGVPAWLIHYGMLALITSVSVASFEAVGSILVIAMLVAPGATALLLTQRWGWVFTWAGVLGALAGVIGSSAALIFNTSVAGAVCLAAGGLFLLSALLSPTRGVVPRAIRQLALSLRIRREDLLTDLYRAQVEGRNTADVKRTPEEVSRGMMGYLAVRSTIRRGWIIRTGSGLQLTDSGVEAAATILRAHRLWEAYLAREGNLPSDHLHDPSERMEHFLAHGLVARLEAALIADARGTGGDLTRDPQGRAIPPANPHTREE